MPYQICGCLFSAVDKPIFFSCLFIIKHCLLSFLFNLLKNRRKFSTGFETGCEPDLFFSSEIRDCRHVQIFRHFCPTKNGQLYHQAI